MLPDPEDDIEPYELTNVLIGEAVRRVMVGEIENLPPEIAELADAVFYKLLPVALTRSEWRTIEAETGLFPNDFEAKHAHRFRKEAGADEA